MRKCSSCKENKPFGAFNKKRNGLQHICKDCNSAYLKQHYLNNKVYYKDKSVRHSNELKRKLFDFLSNNACVDCGEADPIVLQFDHIESNDKSFNISSSPKTIGSWVKIEQELKKCLIRCANCHARRTAKQFNWYRWLEN